MLIPTQRQLEPSTMGTRPPRSLSSAGADGQQPAYRGYHEYSFAHATMGKRLPTILAKAIDDVVKTLNEQSDEDRIKDLLGCIERMEDLMDDLQDNVRPLDRLRLLPQLSSHDQAKLRPIIDECAQSSQTRTTTLTAGNQWTDERHGAVEQAADALFPRQGLHDRPVAIRRGVQVPPSRRMLRRVQILGRLVRQALSPCFSKSSDASTDAVTSSSVKSARRSRGRVRPSLSSRPGSARATRSRRLTRPRPRSSAACSSTS